MVSRSASRSANGLISDTLSANASRSFEVIFGASSTRSKLTRRSASGARPTSSPSSDPDTRHGIPGVTSCRGIAQTGAEPEVVRFLVEAEVVAPRHVAGEQHRAVGIADLHGVGDRQQHMRQHLIAEFTERLGQPRGVLEIPGALGSSQLVDDFLQRVVLARCAAESAGDVDFLIVPGALRDILERTIQTRNQGRQFVGRQTPVRQRLADAGQFHRDVERDTVLLVAHPLQAAELRGAEVEAIRLRLPRRSAGSTARPTRVPRRPAAPAVPATRRARFRRRARRGRTSLLNR